MPILRKVLVSASNQRFAVFFLILLTLLLLPPYFRDATWLNYIWRGLLTATLLWAIFAVSSSHRALILTALILLPTLISTWLGITGDASIEVHYVDNLTNIAYFGLICAYLATFIFTTRRVTSEVLFASMCFYILLAVLWGAIYTNIELFFGDAFTFYGSTAAVAGIERDDLFSYLNYYSFVTLSTLGYGDIIPVHPVSRSWAAVEAMVGQFFIAIVIARLVALYTMEQSSGRN